MAIERPKRYLGDATGNQVHDTLAEHPSCRLDQVPETSRRWYDSLAQARAELPYTDCPWCLGLMT